MVAQLVWDQWVGGSNPLSPTNFEPRFGGVFCFLLFLILLLPLPLPLPLPPLLSLFLFLFLFMYLLLLLLLIADSHIPTCRE